MMCEAREKGANAAAMERNLGFMVFGMSGMFFSDKEWNTWVRSVAYHATYPGMLIPRRLPQEE